MTLHLPAPHDPGRSPAPARERWTAVLEPPSAASVRPVVELLDHRTRCRAVPRALAPPGRYLAFEHEGTELLIPLHRPIAHIGRGLIADIRLEDSRVSRRHAIVALRGGQARILDTRSSNGTFVNDVRVTAAVLTDGDLVRFGPVALRFSEVGPVHRRPVEQRTPLSMNI